MQERSRKTNEPRPATQLPAAKPRPKRSVAVKRAWGTAVPNSAENAELKRASIVREAARAFNRSGFHGTSMDDIAGHLGVSKAALYRYVRTKHDVLYSCFCLGLDSGEAHLDRAEKASVNGLAKLRVAARGYLEDILTKLGHPVVLLEENALLPHQARSVIRRRDDIEKRFRSLVREGIEDGSIFPCDPKLAVFSILGAVNWVPKWYRDDGEWSAIQVAESLVDIAIGGIASKRHAPAEPGAPPGT